MENELPTTAQVIERFNRCLPAGKREPRKNLEPDQYIQALNDATGGNWSTSASIRQEPTERKSPLAEIITALNPLMWLLPNDHGPSTLVEVELTVPAQGGPVTRRGSAKGTQDTGGYEPGLEKQALARAISNLRTGS